VLTLTVEDKIWIIIPLLIMTYLINFDYVSLILAIIFAIICIGLILISENDDWTVLYLIMTLIITFYDKKYNHKKHDHE
jgi:hypothetical protein